MTERNDSLLVAEYALGLLERDDAVIVEQRLEKESALRTEFTHWAEHFATLYEPVGEVKPPPGLKAKIYKRLFTGSQQDAPKPFPWLWSLRRAAGLALLCLVGYLFYQSRQVPPVQFQADHVANLVTEDQLLQVVASYDQENKLLKVAATKYAPAVGRSRELWLIAGDNAPVSLGVLQAIDNENIVITDELASVIVGATLAISDEPSGGSPTGSPTGAVLTTAIVAEM